MTKGINFATAEFENALAKLVNTSGLPPCVLRLVFQRCLSELSAIEKEQAKKEQAEYVTTADCANSAE